MLSTSSWLLDMQLCINTVHSYDLR